MPDLSGANAYFEGTTRRAQWSVYAPADQLSAIQEAASMISRLSLYPRPPRVNLDGAAYEQALSLLNAPNDEEDTRAAISRGIKSRSLDGASEAYADAKDIPGYLDGLFLCPRALSWVSAYLGRVRPGRIVI